MSKPVSQSVAAQTSNRAVQQPTASATTDTGRPRTLDDQKRNAVCALLAAGISLRQAARIVDCDPQTIRREAQRDDHFRNLLANAKSEATLHPLETLREAAKTNWRAALAWMERLEPERSAHRGAPAVTKGDVNKYVATLIEAVERIVTNAWEREHLFEILSAAMPGTIRRCWEGVGPRREIQQIIREHGETTNSAVHKRHWQRLDKVQRIASHLPEGLRDWLYDNQDVVKIRESQPKEAGSEREKRLAEAKRHAARTNGDASNA